METKQDFQAKLEAQLEKWAVTIGDLAGKAERATVEAKAEYRRYIEDLRTKQQAARQKLHELKSSSGDAWTDLRAGAEQAWEDLRAAIEKAVAKFK